MSAQFQKRTSQPLDSVFIVLGLQYSIRLYQKPNRWPDIISNLKVKWNEHTQSHTHTYTCATFPEVVSNLMSCFSIFVETAFTTHGAMSLWKMKKKKRIKSQIDTCVREVYLCTISDNSLEACNMWRFECFNGWMVICWWKFIQAMKFQTSNNNRLSLGPSTD